jgi:hypothetical protein
MRNNNDIPLVFDDDTNEDLALPIEDRIALLEQRLMTTNRVVRAMRRQPGKSSGDPEYEKQVKRRYNLQDEIQRLNSVLRHTELDTKPTDPLAIQITARELAKEIELARQTQAASCAYELYLNEVNTEDPDYLACIEVEQRLAELVENLNWFCDTSFGTRFL